MVLVGEVGLSGYAGADSVSPQNQGWLAFEITMIEQRMETDDLNRGSFPFRHTLTPCFASGSSLRSPYL